MPSNPKRSAPGRTGTTTPDAATPTETAAIPEAPRPAPPSPPPAPAQPRLNITDLKDMSIQKLTQIAKDLTVGGATGMRKQELIFQILKAQTELSGFIFSEGVLEV